MKQKFFTFFWPLLLLLHDVVIFTTLCVGFSQSSRWDVHYVVASWPDVSNDKAEPVSVPRGIHMHQAKLVRQCTIFKP